jgi:hypothetical protein
VDQAGWYRDIVVPVEQTEPILFTLYWPQEDRWEGTNYTVQVRPVDGTTK